MSPFLSVVPLTSIVVEPSMPPAVSVNPLVEAAAASSSDAATTILLTDEDESEEENEEEYSL